MAKWVVTVKLYGLPERVGVEAPTRDTAIKTAIEETGGEIVSIEEADDERE